MKTPDIRIEDSEPIEVEAVDYKCRHCGKRYSTKESARRCCATSTPCKCGGRKPKYYTFCDRCAEAKRCEEWLAKPYAQWDGSFPVGEYVGDEYHFGEEYLIDAICEFHELEWGSPLTFAHVEQFCDGARVCICERVSLPKFEINNFLSDYLPDDCEVEDSDEIDQKINAIIEAAKIPESYLQTGQRIDPRAIAAALGVVADGGDA